MNISSWHLAASTILILALGSGLPAQTIGLNFTGSSLAQSGFRPPDTMGSVGPDHIVEMINGRYAVYDKLTGTQLTASSLNGFWAAAGAPHAGNFAFDPRVQFDPFANRFYASSVDNSRGPNNILFAVSNTDNPLAGWTGFSVDADSDDQQWSDFPQMGFNADRIVISNNISCFIIKIIRKVNRVDVIKEEIQLCFRCLDRVGNNRIF